MTYAAVAYASGPYAGPQAASQPGTDEPAVSVEVAFTSGPLDENPVWVQVPHRSGSITRGRQAELGRFNAGKCTVVLPNADRTYDPKNAASPYSGQMRPMKRLRVLATYAGVTYPLFMGWVDSWNQQRNPPNDAVAIVTATDGQKILGAADLPSSAYAREVLSDNPIRWYRLGEPAGSTRFFDSVSDDDLTITGAPTLAVAGLVSREANAAMKITADSQGAQRTGPATSRTAITVEFLFRYDSDGAIYAAELNDISTAGWALIRAGSSIRLNLITDGTSATSVDAAGIQDGLIHHYAFTWDGAVVTSYLDGVATASKTATGNLPATTVLGIGAILLDSSFYGGQRGSYDELAIYATALSPARIAAHAAAVATPWNGDTPGQRVARVLDAARWPANLRELDTGQSVLQSASTAGQTVLAHAQKTADSEFGELVITGNGTVRLVQRSNLLNKTSESTFSDNNTDIGYVSLSGDFDEVELANDVTVSRVEGVAQQVEDTTSIGDYTRHSRTIDGLYHNSDTLSRDAAAFLVSEYKAPLDRLTGMTLVRPESTTLAARAFPQMLGRQLLDNVTVEQTPQHVGAVDSRKVRIEGIRHSWAPRQWRTEWSLSPALTGNFLQLDNPNTTIEGANAARLFF